MGDLVNAQTHADTGVRFPHPLHSTGTECRGDHERTHLGHDQWHLMTRVGWIWCRTCQVEFKWYGNA